MSDIQQRIEGNEKKRGSGGGKCCLYGCLSILVLMVLLGVVGFFGAKHAMKIIVAQYTQDAPMAVAEVKMSDSATASVEERWEAFVAQAQNGGSVTIELTADEVNALIANNEDWQALKGKAYLNFGEDVVNGKVSLSLEETGWKMLKGRYFNGESSFLVSCENGRLNIQLESMRIGDKMIPAPALAAIKQMNLADEIYQDPSHEETVEMIKRVRKLQFLPNRMIIEIDKKP